MTQNRVRQLLAGTFACHAVAAIIVSIIAASVGGRLLVVGLALAAAVSFARVSAGRVVGTICLALLTFRMVWMLVESAAPMLSGIFWLATYAVTSIVLVTHGGDRPLRAATTAAAVQSAILLWTLWAYARGIISVM